MKISLFFEFIFNTQDAYENIVKYTQYAYNVVGEVHMKFIFNKTIKGSDIKRFRDSNNLTVFDMAELLSISNRTLERWEYSDSTIKGPACVLLRLLNDDTSIIEKYRIEKKTYPLRLIYYCGNEISTIIDVNNVERKVKFKNYTNNVTKRAFGPKNEVEFEEYEEFLESRCIPRTRDKLKIALEEIGVPFYDPYLIIKKTEGRTVEDDCWIKIGD